MRLAWLALLTIACGPAPEAIDAGDTRDAPSIDAASTDVGDDAPILVDGADRADGFVEPDAFVAMDAGLATIVQVAIGARQVCALDASGAVSCWGGNEEGELGTGGPRESRARPARVIGITDAVEIGAGSGFSCARRAGGTVACWGSCWVSGDPDCATDPELATDLLGLTDAQSLSVGDEHACALTSSGDAYCWGNDEASALGRGHIGQSWPPGLVTVAGPFTLIAAGSDYTCGVLAADHTLRCWGIHGGGVLGDGVDAGGVMTTPIAPVGLPSDIVSLSLAVGYACAQLAEGSIWCWGYVPGSDATPTLPALYPALDHAQLFRESSPQASCFVTDGTVVCAGLGVYGQLGRGVIDGELHALGPVPGLEGVTSASASFWTECAVAHGAVYCWGNNAWGECDDTRASACPSPTLVPVF